MLGHQNHYEAGGACSFPVVDKGTTVPGRAYARGSAIPYGAVVAACIDDTEPGIDSAQIDGATSPLQNVKLAATADVSFPKNWLYGVCVESEGIADDERGMIATKNVTVEVQMEMVSGGIPALTPVMADLSTPGFAIESDGTATEPSTAKVIGLVAQSIPSGFAADGATILVYVHLDGVNGFGH